eukprot:TRINITY_DN10125_c0_g1_i1.p2 TRINITY_DN10125_c0_g1~~TRINITY_DN10125_c0_g1_i1.p2  ORF type:complete len:124 (-),score=29.26 TRINITY_DN10125_c0_g1_i1:253-624(-)
MSQVWDNKVRPSLQDVKDRMVRVPQPEQEGEGLAEKALPEEGSSKRKAQLAGDRAAKRKSVASSSRLPTPPPERKIVGEEPAEDDEVDCRAAQKKNFGDPEVYVIPDGDIDKLTGAIVCRYRD